MLFWWNDEVYNKELVESIYITQFQDTKLEKIDDYTVKFTFSKPFPNFDYTLAKEWDILAAGSDPLIF